MMKGSKRRWLRKGGSDLVGLVNFMNGAKSSFKLLIFSVALGGCVAAPQSAGESLGQLDRGSGKPGILLMPLDVELSETGAGGLPVPREDWTRQAERHIARVLGEQMNRRSARLIHYIPPGNDPEKTARRAQLVKLHEAVGLSIIRHKLTDGARLPGKADKFDWSLGPSVRELAREFDTNYALFVLMRDTYASAGRIASIVLQGAGTGDGQLRFSSLVDLRDGNISKFNQLARPEGDLRTLAAARKSVGAMMGNFPR